MIITTCIFLAVICFGMIVYDMKKQDKLKRLPLSESVGVPLPYIPSGIPFFKYNREYIKSFGDKYSVEGIYHTLDNRFELIIGEIVFVSEAPYYEGWQIFDTFFDASRAINRRYR